MNSTTTRLLKEARVLFWPWCVVTIGGALPLIQRSDSDLSVRGFPHLLTRIVAHPLMREGIGPLCVFLGLPLLATLSLGGEFRYGTLSLLLSQPASRMRIWAEKMSVAAVAVLSAALIQAYAWRDAFPWDPPAATLAVVSLTALVGSAVYWTLVARSTMGGLALNLLVQYLVVGGGAILVEWTLGPKPSPAETRFALSIGALIALCYVGLMLWLGRRKLTQFQVTGGVAGSDLLMTGPIWIPEALAGWFRCRPTGAALNLIRKELRLQRPIWLIAPVVVLSWICIVGYDSAHPSPDPLPQGFKLPLEIGRWMDNLWQSPSAQVIPFIAGLIVAGGGCLMPILAGCLGLGEERTWGTYSWHMTLPVSARRQWSVKLVMAMFTSLFCTALLPVAAAGGISLIFGSPSWLSGETLPMLTWSSLLTLASFWCACAVSGTSRAALWVVPALPAVYLAGLWGDSSGQSLEPASGTLRDLAVASFHLSPFAFANIAGAAAAFWVVPTLLLAVVQSYRMFRVQPRDGNRRLLQRLLWLTIVAFLCSFAVNASGFGRPVSPLYGGSSGWQPLREVLEATQRLEPRMANVSEAHPMQLGADDLPGAASLSLLTRRWLHDSRITVTPDNAGAGYSATIHATIHLAGGSDCHWRVAVRRSGRWLNLYMPSCEPGSR
jgi:ABC-type transport system involved in multi-copper enzyme maturation permease subunit